MFVTDKQYFMDEFLVNKLELMITRMTGKGRDDNVILIDGDEGQGKCQPEGSKVLMADGTWKNIEDIKEGDIVLSPQQNGSSIFAKVIGLSKWFSNKNYDIIQLNKKHNKLYSCSSNHLIPINIVSKHRVDLIGNKRKRKWRIDNVVAEDYAKFSYEKKRNSTSLSSFKIDKFMNKENCKIEPYALGVFLGDGSFSSIRDKKHNWLHRKLVITNSDSSIMEEVSKFYPIMNLINKKDNRAPIYDFSLNGDFSLLLSEYKLEGKGSGNKFIPKEALLSDGEYRIRLLAGLIDTDGYYYDGNYQFTLKSKELIEDIKNLTYSLGGRTGEIRQVIKKCQTGAQGKYYSLSIYLGNLSLPLKKDYKIKPITKAYLSSNRLSIDIKESKPCMVYGFTVESPSSWYITDNWMITHNTNLEIGIAYYVSQRTGRPFDITKNVFFDLDELTKIAANTEDNIICWDEGALGGLAAEWWKKNQQRFLKLLMVCRKKRHLIIICVPKYFKLNEYIVVDRSIALIHVYAQRNIDKGYFYYYSKYKKELLFRNYRATKARAYSKFVSFKGKFAITEGLVYDDEVYNEMKDKAILSVTDTPEVKSKKEIMIENKIKKYQDRIIAATKKEGFNRTKVAQLLGIPFQLIRSWELTRRCTPTEQGMPRIEMPQIENKPF